MPNYQKGKIYTIIDNTNGNQYIGSNCQNTLAQRLSVHCSDLKRETMYVREENKWEKDNSETKQMIKAVRGVDKKNYKMLTSWKEMDPKCVDSKSNQCDKYMKIMSLPITNTTFR